MENIKIEQARTLYDTMSSNQIYLIELALIVLCPYIVLNSDGMEPVHIIVFGIWRPFGIQPSMVPNVRSFH